MDELRACLELLERSRLEARGAVWATVVQVAGSSYRRPGAHMAIAGDGSHVGSVSGGCLDTELARKAAWWTRDAQPVLMRFDTSEEEGAIALGCGGTVDVLLEPVADWRSHPRMGFLEACVHLGRPGVLATVFRADPELGLAPGDHLALMEGGAPTGTIEHPTLFEWLLDDATEALSVGTTEVRSYWLPEGHVELLFECVRPPLPLWIFGAGPDVVPVVTLAKTLGWRVTVVDPRQDLASKTRFAAADGVLLGRPSELALALTPEDFAVVMTHSFEADRAVLRHVLASPARYVGIMGPRRRTDRILSELMLEGISVRSEDLARLYAPVGLDLGGDTPEAIALSIVGEIQAIHAGASGTHLRSRRGSIHADEA